MARQQTQEQAQVALTPEQRLVKAVANQIAYQQAHPSTNADGNRTYDPTRVVYFTHYEATKLSFADTVRGVMGLDKVGYNDLVRRAVESGMLVSIWRGDTRFGRCLTLPQYAPKADGPVTRYKGAAVLPNNF